MPSVRKDKYGTWYARIHLNGKTYTERSLGKLTSKRAAINAARDLEKRLKEPKQREKSASKFKEFANNSIIQDELHNHPDTISGKWQCLHRFYTHLETKLKKISGDIQFTEIDRNLCHQYIAEQQHSGANPSTLRKDCTILRRIFEQAVNEEHIERNPWRGIQPPAANLFDPQPFSHAELQRLCSAAPEHRRLRYLMLFYTGADLGQIQTTRWEHIDWARQTITINRRSKGKRPNTKTTTIPLAPPLILALKMQKQPSGPIFESKNNWRRDFILDCQNAQIKPHTPIDGKRDPNTGKALPKPPRPRRIKDLRHGCVTHLRSMGVSQEDVAALIGHTTTRMTARYDHWTRDHAAVKNAWTQTAKDMGENMGENKKARDSKESQAL